MRVCGLGIVSTLAGSSYGKVDGMRSNAAFEELAGIAITSLGDIFVLDGLQIRKLSAAGLSNALLDCLQLIVGDALNSLQGWFQHLRVVETYHSTVLARVLDFLILLA